MIFKKIYKFLQRVERTLQGISDDKETFHLGILLLFGMTIALELYVIHFFNTF